MTQVIHQSELNRGLLKKCGEISALMSEDRDEFFFTCGFCEFAYDQLDNFIQHIYEDHLSELPGSYIKEDITNTSNDTSEHYGLEDIVKVNIQDNLEDSQSCEKSEEEDVDPEGLEIGTNIIYDKSELVQNVKNEELDTTQASIHSDEDSTNDVQKKIFASEILPNEQDSLENKLQHYSKHEESNDDKESMEFIAVECEKKQGKSKPIAKEIKITETILNVAECIMLASIYKEYTCLWDEKDIAYRFKNRRDGAYRSVRQDFNNKTGMNLSQYDFDREVLRIRKICSYEKKQKIMCKQKNIEQKKSSCAYYNYIEYLEVDVPPFECSRCSKLFPALGKLKVHESSHDGSLPFKCHICGHDFQLGNNLTTHLRRHAQDYIYNCDLCNKTCATSTEKKLHMRTHTGERPFVCSICGTRWISSSQLTAHTKCHEKLRRYKCEVCPKTFYSPGTLREHKTVHAKVRNFICDVCDKAFKSRKNLTQHKLIHASEKRYLCKLCGKRYAQAAGLCGHMKSHGIPFSTTSTDNVT